MNEYVVTIAGPERHNGEQPYDYLIDADSPEEAAAASMRVHLTREEEDPNFDPASPGIDGTPTYIVVNVDAGRAGHPYVNDLRGLDDRPDRGETVTVEWQTTTITQYEARLPVAAVRKIMAELGYDPATTDMISEDAAGPTWSEVLARYEWPATVKLEFVEDRSFNVPEPANVQP